MLYLFYSPTKLWMAEMQTYQANWTIQNPREYCRIKTTMFRATYPVPSCNPPSWHCWPCPMYHRSWLAFWAPFLLSFWDVWVNKEDFHTVRLIKSVRRLRQGCFMRDLEGKYALTSFAITWTAGEDEGGALISAKEDRRVWLVTLCKSLNNKVVRPQLTSH